MCIVLVIISFYAVLSVVPNGHGYYCSEISFPVFEYESCRFTYQGQEVEGRCKSFTNCSTAIYLWRSHGVSPTTCWYNGFDHVVCCPPELPSITKTAAIANDKILSSNRRKTNSFITSSPTSTTSRPVQTTVPEETRFVLPKINDKCSISDSGLNGTCQLYSECPSAMKLWKANETLPKSCFLEIVCCVEDEKGTDFSMLKNRKLRKNELYCDSRYEPTLGPLPKPAGLRATPSDFRYMAALGWGPNTNDSSSFRCGGVLISTSFVLTAAHCTYSRGQSPVRVKVTGNDLTDHTLIDTYNISQIFVHPMYDVSTRANDIALIQLEYQTYWKPACLWNERELKMNNLTALGYGNIRFAGPSSDKLIKALLLSVPTSECQKSYDEELLDTHICAGESKNDTCQGDSGGPLLMYRNSKFYPYVVGITSFGNPCVGGSPGVYTRVSEYIDWIESIVWKE